MSRPLTPLALRFDRFVQRTSTCWIWKGSTHCDGYGRMWDGRKGPRLAHRISYELAYGSIPPATELHHKCRNRSCVNPTHLVALAMCAHKAEHPEGGLNNRSKTVCPHDHPYTPENTRWYQGRRFCRECHSIKEAIRRSDPAFRERKNAKARAERADPASRALYNAKANARYHANRAAGRKR